jgi:hypothetical protein
VGAGWQSLDQGQTLASWNHYRSACEAARIAESPTWLAHAQAEQAVVLLDTGETTLATELTGHACETTRRSAPQLLRAWLAAAHGEALAADGQQSASLRAFDQAAALMPAWTSPEPDSPYMALDEVHLARWRGHALARFGHPDAITVLNEALASHDPTFVQAEAGLRADLAHAYLAGNEPEQASRQRAQAVALADDIGSVRQRRRLVQPGGRKDASSKFRGIAGGPDAGAGPRERDPKVLVRLARARCISRPPAWPLSTTRSSDSMR